MPESILAFVTAWQQNVAARADHVTATETTTPAYPRTDIRELRRWSTFSEEVVQNRQRLASTDFEPPPPAGDRFPINSEPAVQYNLSFTVLSIVVRILSALGHRGSFSDCGGNSQVLAAPDLIWVSGGQEKPKLVAEVKTPWSFDAVRDDLAGHQDDRGKKKLDRAIQQVYGYLTFNHVKYGFLTTGERTWFLRRSHSGEGGVLEVSDPWYSATARDGITLLEAFTHLLLLVEEGTASNHWFYVSPTTSPLPIRRSLVTKPRPPSAKYEKTEFYRDDVFFREGITRGRAGTVLRGTFRNQSVVLKVVDTTKNEVEGAELANEVEVYKALETLQGNRVPKFVAYGRLWDMLDILILEPAGSPVAADPPPNIISEMRQCLDAVHSCGVVHGDPAPRNFVHDSLGGVRILDFGLSRIGAAADSIEHETFDPFL